MQLWMPTDLTTEFVASSGRHLICRQRGSAMIIDPKTGAPIPEMPKSPLGLDLDVSGNGDWILSMDRDRIVVYSFPDPSLTFKVPELEYIRGSPKILASTRSNRFLVGSTFSEFGLLFEYPEVAPTQFPDSR